MLIAFIVLAAISCWATEHSFHLLTPWPQIFVWALTIAFFVLASYGTKMMVDGLNKDLLLENRRRTFWFGIVLVALFWLFMSMPTNTHTFFYNHKIGDVVQSDMLTTRSYLEQISQRTNVDSSYYQTEKKVDSLFAILQSEFRGEGNSTPVGEGNGKYVNERLTQISDILKSEPHGTPVVFNSQRMNSRDYAILQDYENQKNASLERIREMDHKVGYKEAKEAKDLIENIDTMMNTIKLQVQTSGRPTEAVVKQTEGVLSNCYACIKNNEKYVDFKDNDADKKVYTAENPETRTKRMLSVIDVWIDFLGGKYPLSFIFYVLLSVLVDLGAFLFFDLTFKKEY